MAQKYSNRNNEIQPYKSPNEDFIQTETKKLFKVVESFCRISGINSEYGI